MAGVVAGADCDNYWPESVFAFGLCVQAVPAFGCRPRPHSCSQSQSDASPAISLRRLCEPALGVAVSANVAGSISHRVSHPHDALDASAVTLISHFET